MTLLLWAVSLLWLLTRAADGQWVAAAIGALLLVNLQPIVLAFEFFVLLPWHNRRDALPRPGFGQLVRAWWRESVTAHNVFGWQQPFRSQRHADHLDDAQGRRAIVLVHGFMCNRGVWNRWMPALRAQSVPHVAVTLEPPMGGIDGYVEAIDEAIERAARATGLAPLLVGHSMGGIALRAWWRAHASTAADRVHGVVTIASPHAGTVTAALARADNARQMRRDSAWLRELAAAEGDGRRRRFTCFYSHCDNIVLPASSALLPGADNRHVEGQPHVALIHAPQVWDDVLRRVRDAC
jgi:triacylglycerol esterase/lipase EstA (alpha/beta hydrolase family)